MTLEYVIVFILSIVAGGWAIPAGLLMGVPPVTVYVLAVLGGTVLAVVMLIVGGRARGWVVARFFPDGDERLADGRAAELLDRWGVPGLATLGTTLLGPTVTLVTAVALGVDRRRFLVWYVAGTVVGLAALTLLWTVVT